jgi:hypothetical protein
MKGIGTVWLKLLIKDMLRLNLSLADNRFCTGKIEAISDYTLDTFQR